MFLKEASLGNIRPFSYKKIKFQKGINTIFGGNGSGKTTILEAIHLLSLGKSFKTAHANEFIKDNEKTYKITGTTNGKNKIEIKGTKDKKTIIKNEKTVKKLTSHIRALPIIINTPDEIVYHGDHNNKRQKNLNKNICLIDLEYMDTLKKYNKTLKQRNKAIKQRQKFSVWDPLMVDFSLNLWEKRRKYIKAINKMLKKTIIKNEIKKTAKIEIKGHEKVSEKIAEKFYLTLEKDKKAGHTTFGPHRDTIEYFFNNEKIKKQASQGEKSVFFAVLKKAEADIVKREIKEEPIILLDDIFSKTDEKNTQRILNIFKKSEQTIITHTQKIPRSHKNIYIDD